MGTQEEERTHPEPQRKAGERKALLNSRDAVAGGQRLGT